MYVSQRRYRKRALLALIGTMILTAIIAMLVFFVLGTLKSGVDDNHDRYGLPAQITLLVFAGVLWVIGFVMFFVNLVRWVHWAKIASVMTPMVGEVVGQDDVMYDGPSYRRRSTIFDRFRTPKYKSSICIRFKGVSYFTPYLFTKGEAEWFTGKRAHCCIINRTLYVMTIEGSGE